MEVVHNKVKTVDNKVTKVVKSVPQNVILFGKSKKVDISRLNNKELLYFFERINNEVIKRCENDEVFLSHFHCERNKNTIVALVERFNADEDKEQTISEEADEQQL